ncbi:hypothetical protein HTZ77_38195 [Nonomuraea sp. SMC257]|uniref:Enolase C-terminal domain-containing protein n=1 Tax=Nonomuraea montanisoli TaxID=2741721 RepID=A0A7Y6IGL2_9ACTN|nr:enolase C-terminal domain-like protein [Nonomuraea montanisoli]NUW37195.1 hypothetical protein [Nonomuraea montanisoli]
MVSLTQMARIAAVADVHYVPVAPHNPLGPLATAANAHFAAATTNFAILEYKPDEVSWCPDPYLPVDGRLELRPEQPGWGDLTAPPPEDRGFLAHAA